MKTEHNKKPLKTYSPAEEKLNIISHGIGAILSIIALLLMMLKVFNTNNSRVLISVIVYSFSLITLYTASTLFHSAKEHNLRYRLNIFDHCAIFLLIAGTYTPFSILTIQGSLGWIILSVIWTAAVGGIILKLFYTGRYRILSTIMYVLMGWIAAFAFKPLYNNLSFEGFAWLVMGGVAYTLGAILYALKKIKFNHAIFHFFVLIASICHFISIYFYVLNV